MPQRLERLVTGALRLQCGGERFELINSRRALARAREVPGHDIDIEQLRPHLIVCGIEDGRLAQRRNRIVRAALVEKLGRDLLEVANRADRVAQLDTRAGRSDPCVEVAFIQLPEADANLRRSARVAARPAAFDQCAEPRARLRQQTLARRDLRGLEQRMFVIRPELENFLVESAGLLRRLLPRSGRRNGKLPEPCRSRRRTKSPSVLAVAQSWIVFDDAEVFCNGRLELPCRSSLTALRSVTVRSNGT